MTSKTPDMELVNHTVPESGKGLGGLIPAEIIVHHPGLVEILPAQAEAPAALAGDRLCVRIQQILCLVENQALLRLKGAVDGVGVFKFVNFQAVYKHGEHIPHPVMGGKGKAGIGGPLPAVEEKQGTGDGAEGNDGKIHPVGEGGGAIYLIKTGAHVKALDSVLGREIDDVLLPQKILLFHRTAPFVGCRRPRAARRAVIGE